MYVCLMCMHVCCVDILLNSRLFLDNFQCPNENVVHLVPLTYLYTTQW